MPDKGKAVLGVGALIGVIAIAVAASRVKAAPKPPEPPPGLATLYGRVTDAITQQPVSGALVAIVGMGTGISISTDSEGYYVFQNVEPGEYELSVGKEGYQTWVA